MPGGYRLVRCLPATRRPMPALESGPATWPSAGDGTPGSVAAGTSPEVPSPETFRRLSDAVAVSGSPSGNCTSQRSTVSRSSFAASVTRPTEYRACARLTLADSAGRLPAAEDLAVIGPRLLVELHGRGHLARGVVSVPERAPRGDRVSMASAEHLLPLGHDVPQQGYRRLRVPVRQVGPGQPQAGGQGVRMAGALGTLAIARGPAVPSQMASDSFPVARSAVMISSRVPMACGLSVPADAVIGGHRIGERRRPPLPPGPPRGGPARGHGTRRRSPWHPGRACSRGRP